MEDDPDPEIWRAAIESELSALSGESRATEADRAPVTLDQQSVGRLSRMDALQTQAMAAAAERRRLERAARLDAALRRLRDGEYGWCARCGERIPDARLKVDVAAAFCVGCASGG